MNNAGRYFFFVCEYVIVRLFRKHYFDDCGDKRKFTMYPNGDHIFVY